MADREDSWITGVYGAKEEEEEKVDDDAAAIPKRRKRTETPKEREVKPREYIKMVNPLEADDEAAISDPTHRSIMGPRGGRGLADERIEEEEEEEEDEIIQESPPPPPTAVEQSRQQKAPVFTKGENRGPNLNRRASRRRIEDEDFGLDWEIPEMPDYESPPPPSPSPSPPPPPPSCGGTPTPETPPPRDTFNPTEYEKQQEADDYDKKIKEINDSSWADKPLTKWVEGVVVKKTQRAVYKENTEQVEKGLETLATLTEKPLNKFFAIITTLLPYIILAISIIASVIDILRSELTNEANNRGYGYSCFALDMVDVILLTVNALLHKSSWFLKKTEEQREAFEKKQQLLDNVLAEALLYPTIICSLISVATDRVFTEDFSNPDKIVYDHHVGILDLILITFDVASLLYVYLSRMYMVHRFLNNLNSMFPDATDSGSKFAITSRIFYTIVLNALLFGFMIIHLGLQVYHENLPENKPEAHRQREAELGDDIEVIYMSYVAGTMLIATIIVPIFSIVVFILANYYYILELMIKINIHVLKKKDCREKLEEHGEVAQGIMGFAGKNIHATPGRLRDIQSLSNFQRVFYVLREWWIDLIFFIWAVIIVGYCVLFYDYYSHHVSLSNHPQSATTEQQIFSVIYICSFMLCVSLFLLGNYHSFVVVLVTNIIMLPLFFSFAIQALFDKCSEASGKTVKRDKDKFAGIVTLIKKKDDGDDQLPETRPPTKHDISRAPIQFTSRPPTQIKSRPPTQFTLRPPTEIKSKPLSYSKSRPPTVLTIKPTASAVSPTHSAGGAMTVKSRSSDSFVLNMASVEDPDIY